MNKVYLILGIFIIVVAGIVGYAFINIKDIQRSFSSSGIPLFGDNYDCDKKSIYTSQDSDSAEVESDEQFAFVFNKLTDHLTVYSNAKQIKYVLKIQASGQIDLQNVQIEASSLLGSIVEKSSSVGAHVFGGCGSDIVLISVKYQLSTDMINNNLADDIELIVNIDGEKMERTFTVQPAIWTRPTLDTEVVVKKSNDSSSYQTNVGEEILYSVQLKDADGDPLSGRKLTLSESADEYDTIQVVSQFEEIQDGLYQIIVTSDKPVNADLQVRIENETPNPQYNNFTLTFTNQVVTTTYYFPSDVEYATDNNYLTSDGSPFFYMAYLDIKQSSGRTVKRILHDGFNETSLPENSKGFPKEVFSVSHDERITALINKSQKVSTLRLMDIGEGGLLQWPDTSISLKQSVNPVQIFFSPDDSKVVIQSVDAIQIVDLLNKKTINHIPITVNNPEDLIIAQITNDYIIVGILETGTYRQQATITIDIGTNSSSEELQGVDTAVKFPAQLMKINIHTGEIENEASVHNDEFRILSITHVDKDASEFYVLYGKVVELSGSPCVDYPVYELGTSGIKIFSTESLDEKSSFETTIDMGSFVVYIPKKLIFSQDKVFLLSLLRSKYCSRSDEDLFQEEHLYSVDINSHTASPLTTLVVDASRTITSSSNVIQELHILSESTLIHVKKTEVAPDGTLAQRLRVYHLNNLIK